MENTDIKINFSDGSHVIVNENNLLFPIELVNHSKEYFTSAGVGIQLSDFVHVHHGLVPKLTSIFSTSEFFTIDTDDLLSTKIYKTSSIVSLEHPKKVQLKTFKGSL